MGDIGVCLISAIIVFITVLSLIFGWLSYKVNKMKASLNEDEGLIRYILLLEEAMKKLNNTLRSHDRRLDDQLHELSDIKERLDILESGHPDTDIDYGEVDDDANVIAVWFNGKKYIPEDKRNEDSSKLYADNKVVAETTGPEEKRCCANCQHYRPDSGYSTCDLRTWLHTTKKYATMADSACNNYEKISAVLVPSDKDKVEYIRYDRMYKNLGGNGMTERLLKRAERLDYVYSTGLISIATYRHMVAELLQEELTHNDS